MRSGLVAGLGAAAAVLLDEAVLWGGQPTGDPTAATVSAWYTDHAARVLVGDALWVAAALAIALLLRHLSTGLRAPGRRSVIVVGLLSGAVLASSAGMAAWLALGGGAVLDAWRLEGLAYRTGCLVLALALGGLALVVRSRRRTLAVAVAVVAVGLVLPATSLWGLAAAGVVLGLATMRDRAGPTTADGGTLDPVRRGTLA